MVWTDWLDGITFGDKDIDRLLGGGIPRGHAILIEKEPGTKAGLFALKFILSNLADKDNNLRAAYLTTDKDPKYISERAKNDLGTSIEELIREEKFIFIDGFHGGHLRSESEPSLPDERLVNDLRNVQEVHDVLREVMLAWKKDGIPSTPVDIFPKTRAVWVYDSITTMVHFGGNEALTLVGHQMAAQKKHGYSGLFVVQKGSLPTYVMRKLELWADGVISFSMINSDDGEICRVMQIKELRWTDHYCGPIPYEVAGGDYRVIKNPETREGQKIIQWLDHETEKEKEAGAK